MTRFIALAALAVLIAACTPDTPTEPSVPDLAAQDTPTTDGPTTETALADPSNPADHAALAPDYLGRWEARDGSAVVVADPPTGDMMLEFRSADGRLSPSVEGSVTAEGLRFIRNGEAETAVIETRPDGGACLNLGRAETYCRPG